MSLFSPELLHDAESLLDLCRARGMRLATAESCTGGLMAGLLTSIAGSSDVVDRGFVTYSNAAKTQMLGVPAHFTAAYGAVSEEVARAMAEGALANSEAHLAISVTGVAGPGGGTAAKPVGLVHIASARSGSATIHQRFDFGEQDREAIRLKSLQAMLLLAKTQALGP